MSGADFKLPTPRLSLRWITLADAELMLAVWNDPTFIEYVGDRGLRSVEQAHEALRQGAFKLYEQYGYGPYRVALAADDTEIGICGLFRREGFDEPDIGYSILPAYCGRGYAFEAASAVLEYARATLGLTRVTAFIAPANAPSIGLAGKLGLRYERMARLPAEDADVGLYSVALQS
ncbi:MAG: GNAT family N-acetyltransferase [Proteobacteria bacterium]|nr:GNAT family N-acetyltransferase [Pseudomonadota bacterium]MDA1063067.1 GNAT family N-acetyltransferase [Pseudomonadota bacterium]